jgi:hypothetical protein
MSEDSLSLLNIYEIDEEFGTRYFVCFLESVMAGAIGIPTRSIVGEFTPDKDNEFDSETFERNEEFIQAFVQYMNREGINAPELIAQARAEPGGFLYLVDPRHPLDETGEEEPPTEQLIGRFLVDDQGRITPDSFEYNSDHILFDPQSGVSGMLHDRRFYDWLHPEGTPVSEL